MLNGRPRETFVSAKGLPEYFVYYGIDPNDYDEDDTEILEKFLIGTAEMVNEQGDIELNIEMGRLLIHPFDSPILKRKEV